VIPVDRAPETTVLILGEGPSLDVVLATLGRSGVGVVRASDPFDALVRFDEAPAEGVLLQVDDLSAADLDLIPALRRRSPGVRIVLLFTLEHRERAAEGLRRGADAHLLEPFYPAELRALLRLPEPEVGPPSEEARATGSGDPVALERLAGGVAHEINNPLTVIHGWAEILMAEIEPEDPRIRKLQSILDEADRIRRIVNHLQDFARHRIPDAGPLDLNREIRLFFETEKKMGRVGRMRIELALAPDLPRVRANPESVQTVLRHLTRNALRATGGSGTLRVETRREGRDTVAAILADDGPGVPPEHRERIFLPFFSGFTGENCPGLGLAACRGIMRALGGEIDLASGDPSGAVFRIRFRPDRGVPGDAPSG